MSFSSQATQQRFPFAYDAVFDALVKVLPSVDMSVKTTDKVIGRITASAGMSLFSWGENLTLIVEVMDASNTNVGIESALKLGGNFTGAHRHQKNFDKIIYALSQRLQGLDGWSEKLSSGTPGYEPCPKCGSFVSVESVKCWSCSTRIRPV